MENNLRNARRAFVWLVFSLFLIFLGVASVLSGNPGDLRDGYQLIGLGLVLFIGLAIKGSFYVRQ
jgi:hypothetical protein